VRRWPNGRNNEVTHPLNPRPVSKAERRAKASGPRRDVQGLRAVAVLAVIADHLFQWPTGGFIGVDVFFVISGFLITGTLLREHVRTGGISFRGFYVRRIKRIIPAAALTLSATIAASYWLLNETRARDTTVDAVWSFFFAGNWRFAAKGTDYFQQGLLPSPVQHFWSLGVEEQFYLVWPWLMLAVLTVGARKLRWDQRKRSVAVGAVIGVITFSSFVWALQQTATSPTVAYFSTFARAWELGVGALLAIAGRALTIRSPFVRSVLGWVGFVGILVALFVVPQAPGFPAPWAALPVLATALVIVAGQGAEQRHLWPLTNPVSRYLGDISYSLYLWHFPVIVLLVALLPSDSVLYHGAAAVLVFGLAIASYHLVEDPVRKSAWLLPRSGGWQTLSLRARWRRIGLGALAPCTAVLLVGALVSTTPHAPSPVALSNLGSRRSSGTGPDCFGAAAMVLRSKCQAGPQSTSVTPAVDQVTLDTKDAYKCWINYHSALKTCSYGATGAGAVSVALIGDSHAAMLLPGLTPLLLKNNWRLDTYFGWGCQWSVNPVTACHKVLGQIQQRLEKGPRYDIIITTSARQKTGNDKAQVSEEMARAWQPVADRGTKIVVVGDNPLPSQGAMECIQRVGFTAHDDCSTPRSEALSVTDPLVLAAAQVPGSHFVDLTSFFCDTTQCPAVIGNVITYSDTDGHMTGTFSQTLGPYLFSAVKKALG
jgi:peptidoglycan/LPS O-acetylase OafA/YrhL